MNQTRNKVALITGVSSGIGQALAQKMRAEGYFVIGTLRKKPLSPPFQQQAFVYMDLTDYTSIKQAVEYIKSSYSGINLLINNAGIGSDYYEDYSDQENFELRFQTHLFGTYFFTESLLSHIHDDGMIVNVSSKLASFHLLEKLKPEIFNLTKTAYILSKGSLNLYTKILARKLHSRGIKVLSIHPGWVKTTLSKSNQNAPLSIEESVHGIWTLLADNKESGTFWDAQTQEELNW